MGKASPSNYTQLRIESAADSSWGSAGKALVVIMVIKIIITTIIKSQ